MDDRILPTTPGPSAAQLVALTAHVASAYVANNSVQSADIARLIEAIHGSLSRIGKPDVPSEPRRHDPPVSIRKSITPDYIVSLEDGKHYKSLKRHLSGRGMTPEEYRRKWDLPQDYPMVAANYAAKRSELAKAFGLGRKAGVPFVAKAKSEKRVRGKAI